MSWTLLSTYSRYHAHGEVCVDYRTARAEKSLLSLQASPLGSRTLSENLFPLNEANAAHEAQAFIIYEKFIIGPVCGVEEGSHCR